MFFILQQKVYFYNCVIVKAFYYASKPKTYQSIELGQKIVQAGIIVEKYKLKLLNKKNRNGVFFVKILLGS